MMVCMITPIRHDSSYKAALKVGRNNMSMASVVYSAMRAILCVLTIMTKESNLSMHVLHVHICVTFYSTSSL